MPIYEYECERCSCKFELLRNVKEDGGASCPECQGHSPRVFSRMSYIWKGTRYASEKVNKKESSEPKEQSVKKPEDNKNTEKGKKKNE